MDVNDHKILIKPIITEKATFLGAENKYIFEISPRANKIDVQKAFEQTYKIKPIKINIIKVKGKKVRYGRTSGQTKNWKKAIITLKAGDKIELATS
jgi:large subunit ribosomal protein L23